MFTSFSLKIPQNLYPELLERIANIFIDMKVLEVPQIYSKVLVEGFNIGM